MTDINKSPLGLLGLTNSKVGGVNPDNLGNGVAYNIDVEKYFLLQDQKTLVVAAATVNNRNTLVTATPPDGELWYIHHCGLKVSPPAGIGIRELAIEMRNEIGQPCPIAEHAYGNIVDVDRNVSLQDFWLLPGRDFSFWVNFSGAGNGSHQFTLFYTPLVV